MPVLPRFFAKKGVVKRGVFVVKRVVNVVSGWLFLDLENTSGVLVLFSLLA
jgi:hypothetical protein